MNFYFYFFMNFYFRMNFSLGLCRTFGRSISTTLARYNVAGIKKVPAASEIQNELSKDDLKSIQLLRSEKRHYAVVEVGNRPMLVTEHDSLIINRLKGVEMGDVLDLNKVREIGSKNFTLKGNPFVNPNLFKITATVLEHTKGGKHWIIKKKRRKRYQRKIGHRQLLTVLRIREIKVE
jgi:large subunit ribosomal protein L21